MPMAGDGDELIARIAALEPARGTAPLSRRSIRSLVRAATVTPHEARTWTWPRYRLASLGALIGSSALVIAAIVGLDSVGSSLPSVVASAARTAHHPLVPPSSPSMPGYSFNTEAATASSTTRAAGCPVIVADRANTHVLASGPRHATAYRVESLLPPSRALLSLAPAFGLGTSSVKWFSMRAHARGWWVGSLAGPSLTTYSSRGITWWSYFGRRESATQLLQSAGRHGQNLLSSTVSTHDAMELLAGLVPGAQLGGPTVSRSATSEEVVIPLAVHGVVTDLRFDVDYYPGGLLAAAAGPLASVIQEVTFPTISSRSAARLLRRPMGALVALTTPSSATTRESPVPSGMAGSTLYCSAEKSVESVSMASLTLSTNVLSNGHVWLLPTWTYSAIRYASDEVNSVAVSPKYLHYRRAMVRYRTGKRKR